MLTLTLTLTPTLCLTLTLSLTLTLTLEMKDMVVDIREKDHLFKQVSDELEKLPKTINRQAYIRRIMDIVRNLEKQKHKQMCMIWTRTVATPAMPLPSLFLWL